MSDFVTVNMLNGDFVRLSVHVFFLAYMVWDTEPRSSAVKGMDTNLTVQIKSSSQNLPVNISVFVISSPNNALDGKALDFYSYNNEDSIFTYGITITDVSEENEGDYVFNSTSVSADSEIYPNIWINRTQYLYVQGKSRRLRPWNKIDYYLLQSTVIPEDFKFIFNGTEVDENITYIRGESSSTVTCSAYGTPEPVYEWLKSDEAFLSDGVSSNKGILDLKNSFFSDNGTYICNAVNNVSEKYDQTPSSSLYIEVEGECSSIAYTGGCGTYRSENTK